MKTEAEILVKIAELMTIIETNERSDIFTQEEAAQVRFAMWVLEEREDIYE